MKIIANSQIITLNPNDFKGLEARSLQEKVRQVSTIELSEHTAMESILLEVHISSTNKKSPRIFVVFFGKDELSNNQIHWPCAVQPKELNATPEFLYASDDLVTDWYGISNGETLIVERIGFFSNDAISFTPIIKVAEEVGENGFLDMK
jgi:hypothetical protein